VLDEIEIGCGEVLKRMTQIAHDGDGLQKDFGQRYRRA